MKPAMPSAVAPVGVVDEAGVDGCADVDGVAEDPCGPALASGESEPDLPTSHAPTTRRTTRNAPTTGHSGPLRREAATRLVVSPGSTGVVAGVDPSTLVGWVRSGAGAPSRKAHTCAAVQRWSGSLTIVAASTVASGPASRASRGGASCTILTSPLRTLSPRSYGGRPVTAW